MMPLSGIMNKDTPNTEYCNCKEPRKMPGINGDGEVCGNCTKKIAMLCSLCANPTPAYWHIRFADSKENTFYHERVCENCMWRVKKAIHQLWRFSEMKMINNDNA